jgi:16S rRNA (uracil1498-N3)-methyltransferase
MPRVFLPVEENPCRIRIAGEKAHYLATVLRCKEGEELEILDGKGHSFRAKIISVAKKEITAEVLGAVTLGTESPVNLILIQGLLRGEKMDLVIQKATELGVSEIVPAVTDRSQVRNTGKADRWRKIAEDASRQSGRTAIPVIRQVIPFRDIISGDSPYAPSSRQRRGLLFWERKGASLKKVSEGLEGCTSLIIAVGPEGGFTGDEVQRAEERGFLIATLGSRILRAETAAIVATALSQFLFGDMG